MAQAYDAAVVGMEPEKYLTDREIPANGLPQQIDVGKSDDLQVGQKVMAIWQSLWGRQYIDNWCGVSARRRRQWLGRPSIK